MSNLLLGNYSLSASKNGLYLLTFEIPVNCEFMTTSSESVHCIHIKLKEGEKEPADKFVSDKLEFTTANNQIIIEFDQQCDGCDDTPFLKRPIIRVED